MPEITLPIDHLTLYRDAIRNIRTGELSISFPLSTTDCYLLDFESELIQLAAWLEVQFDECNKLLAISADISQGTLFDEVLEHIYDSFRKIIPYDRIGCALISDDYEKVTARWAKTNNPDKIRITSGYSSLLAGSSLEEILKTQQPRIINDLTEYLNVHPDSQSTQLIVDEGIQSSLTCPLIVDGKPIGFIFFSSTGKNTYRAAHKRIFIRIARQISVLIEKSCLYQQINDLNKKIVDAMNQLKEQSCRDALTGVLHRGAIMEFLDQDLNSGKRKHQPTSVIMADVDNFKSINDTYGHIVGDTVLKAISQEIISHLRSYDSVGRYGGEEFLIILSGCNAVEAMVVAERIRRAIAALLFKHENNEFNITISMGISCSDNVEREKNDDSLLSDADRALYRAKREGRNRVYMA